MAVDACVLKLAAGIAVGKLNVVFAEGKGLTLFCSGQRRVPCQHKVPFARAFACQWLAARHQRPVLVRTRPVGQQGGSCVVWCRPTGRPAAPRCSRPAALVVSASCAVPVRQSTNRASTCAEVGQQRSCEGRVRCCNGVAVGRDAQRVVAEVANNAKRRCKGSSRGTYSSSEREGVRPGGGPLRLPHFQPARCCSVPTSSFATCPTAPVARRDNNAHVVIVGVLTSWGRGPFRQVANNVLKLKSKARMRYNWHHH